MQLACFRRCAERSAPRRPVAVWPSRFRSAVVGSVGLLMAMGTILADSRHADAQNRRAQTQGPVQQYPRLAREPGSNGPGRPAPQRPIAPAQPTWIPLNPTHTAYVDKVLGYWEYKSSQTKRYRCTFKRFEYDPVFGPPEKANTYSEGVVKYSAPDKGLFRVDRQLQYQAPRNAGEEPTYVESKGQGEHWICDGHWIYSFDQGRKKLLQSELPPEMRGKAIANGPLPFLFNAKADEIKQRFWVRVVTPPEMKSEYWLEAVPKKQEDAASFKMVHVIIDAADYLPKAMVIYDRNYIQGKRPTRTSFQFEKREVNFSILVDQLNPFHREFHEPSVPSGWVKEIHKWGQ